MPVPPLSTQRNATTASPPSVVTGPRTSSDSRGGSASYAAAIAARPENGPTGTPTNSISASTAKRSAKAAQRPVATASPNAATWASTCSVTSIRGV